jgi:hypothetical protein
MKASHSQAMQRVPYLREYSLLHLLSLGKIEWCIKILHIGTIVMSLDFHRLCMSSMLVSHHVQEATL